MTWKQDEREPLAYRPRGRSDDGLFRDIAQKREDRLYEAMGLRSLQPMEETDEIIRVCSMIVNMMGGDNWRDPPDAGTAAPTKGVTRYMLGILITMQPDIRVGSNYVRWFTAEQEGERFVCAVLPPTLYGIKLLFTSSQQFYERLKMATRLVYEENDD